MVFYDSAETGGTYFVGRQEFDDARTCPFVGEEERQLRCTVKMEARVSLAG
ncbi:hypothetical protein GCM10008018_43090 [Paenibacillus marchantiophytorum]|uniref:Uncharacterized protein n=1 Tax=Paenibacillus marchantiophytorum TaxID=1619310 RepID=A0ABQ1EYT4_9BACL|nr:hypothetical protein GCM10008018_43090 [Paenibacillus marchantiophytorum]